MKTLCKRGMAVLLAGVILMQSCLPIRTASAKETNAGEDVICSTTSSSFEEKSEELVKQLAKKGIQKAIGKIPVVGGLVNSFAGSYIDKLLGIKAGESTNDKLDKLSSKVDSLVNTIEQNNHAEMKKIYESKFDTFDSGLSMIQIQTKLYLQTIADYERELNYNLDKIGDNNTEERNIEDMNATLKIASLSLQGDFLEYYNRVIYLSQVVKGENVSLYQYGDIYSRAFLVFCDNALDKYGCALGGEAAMMASEYVNSINEIIDTAQTTLAMILISRCCVGDHKDEYAEFQKAGKITDRVNLNDFKDYDQDIMKKRYETVKEDHYYIFGVTEEDVSDEKDIAGKKLVASEGLVGKYNRMIEDRWFDYIDSTNFSGNIPEVNFCHIDSQIGFAVIEDLGFDFSRANNLIEDYAEDYIDSVSKSLIARKTSAIDNERWKKLMKHIETSENFKYEKEFEGADYDEISLRNALSTYGFSFAEFDASRYNSQDYAKIFATNAKCSADYTNGISTGTHDAYIDGYVYGIDPDTSTAKMNQSSSEKKYQFFSGHFSSNSSDKINVNYQRTVMMYFKKTEYINDTKDFMDFIEKIAGGTTFEGVTVNLNDDINLNKSRYLEHWPDSARKNEFRGTFCGNGRTITGLTISAGENRLGLFRTTGEGAVIKDLNLKDVTISNTGDYVGYGALVGYSNGNLTIENVNVISGSITGYKCVGGLVGETKEGKYATVIIKNCVNNVPVTSKNVDAGGLIGNGASVYITNCVNNGAITAADGAAGGMTGYIGSKDTDPRVKIEKCTNNGAIIGCNCAGGICGNMETDYEGFTVVGCENTADVTVTGRNSAGGIIGRTCAGGTISNNTNCGNIENLSTNDNACAGGILGDNEDDAITMEYNVNTGNVTANSRAGGIAGTLGDRDHDKVCTLEYNRNGGKIVSKNKDAGGIAGAIATDNRSHVVTQNVNNGSIQAKSEAGGIVGWMAGGGLFTANTNSAKIISEELNAGGIVGRIQDDPCDFKSSNVGNPFAGSGSISPRSYSDRDYLIHAKNSKQHAGKICGWDGKKSKKIDTDTLSASVFNNGSPVLVLIMSGILIVAAAIFIIVFKKKKTVKSDR